MVLPLSVKLELSTLTKAKKESPFRWPGVATESSIGQKMYALALMP